MKPMFTMRSGGPGSWALRLCVAGVLVALAIWIPTSSADPTGTISLPCWLCTSNSPS